MIFDDNPAPESNEESSQQAEQQQENQHTEFSLDALPSELRENKVFDNLRSKTGTELLVEMGKQIQGLNRMQGSRIPLPSGSASTEDMNEFFDKIKHVDGVYRMPTNEEETKALYQKLGVPDSKEAYHFEDESLSLPAEKLESYVQFAADNNLSKEQFKALALLESGNTASTLEQRSSEAAKVAEECKSRLQNEWTTGFEGKVEDAKSTLETLSAKFGKETVEHLKTIGADSNPAIVWLLAETASQFRESGTLFDKAPLTQAKSVTDVKEELKAIRNNPAYFKQGKEREALLAKQRELMAQLGG